MLRRIEPITGLLVLACVGWTLTVRYGLEWTVAEAGALQAGRLWDGEYWRLFTAAVLHDLNGWLHLVCNTLGLVLIGPMVARDCGRRTYGVVLLFSVMAGWVASLTWYPSPRMWHLGISGGLFGLIGLLLAVEWAMAASWRDFLKQRNTWVLLAVVVLGVAATEYMNRRAALFASQAGHLGGLAFGLLFGLAYYGRPRCRRRPVWGAAAVLLLGVLPAAYLCFPVADSNFLLYKGERAWADERPDGAAFYYGMALRIDAGNPLAGARLAVHRDDPALLRDLRGPEDLTRVQPRLTQGFVATALLHAHLFLARGRLEEDPGTAAGLVESARGIHPADPRLWLLFATQAEAAGRDALALLAYGEAMRASQDVGARSVPALAALGLVARRVQEAPPEERLSAAVEAAEHAEAACYALPGLGEEARAHVEVRLAGLGVVLARVARDEDPDGRLAGSLTKLFWLLANNSVDPAREPAYLWQRALLLDREAVQGRADPADVETAMRGVLGAAREYGDGTTGALAEAWFRERGLPVPDLAPPGGDR